MGVKGLKQFVEDHQDTLTEKRIFRSPCQAKDKKVLVVDGLSCLRVFYNPRLDWLCGGQWTELRDELYGFVRRFRTAGFQLVVIFDGVVERGKRSVWIQRRKQDLRKIRHVFEHVKRTGHQPKRNMLCLPAALSTFVKMALKSAGVEVINSLGEADKEIAQYCLSKKCYGILGEDSDYLIYPIQNYFTTKDIHVGEKRVMMIRYDREKFCQLLRISASRLPVLAGLCGNDLLDANRLVGFHRRITGVAGGEKPVYREIVSKVAQFINRFPDSVSPEQIVARALGSADDSRLSLFRRVLVVYDLTTSVDTYLTSRDSQSILESPITKGRLHETSEQENVADIINENMDPPWVHVDDTLFKNDENDFSIWEEDDDGDVETNDDDIEAVNDDVDDDDIDDLVSGADCEDTTDDAFDAAEIDVGVSSKALVTSNQPCTCPLVMKEARKRHSDAEIVHLVYQVMCVAEIDMGCTLEDPANDKNIPPANTLFRPIRERLYGILLGLREMDHTELKSHNKKIAKKDDLVVGQNAVKEWCVYRGKTLSEVEIVPALPVPKGLAFLEELWVEGDIRKQMKAFCYCLGWPDMPYEELDIRRRLLCGVLHFMVNEDKLKLKEWELDAFLVQATDTTLGNTGQLHRVRIQCPDCRAIELAAIFMRGLYMAVLAYNACGMKFDDDATSPWLCFNGKLFHQKYLDAKKGKSFKCLCTSKRHVTKVSQLKSIIMSGTMEFTFPSAYTASRTLAYTPPRTSATCTGDGLLSSVNDTHVSKASKTDYPQENTNFVWDVDVNAAPFQHSSCATFAVSTGLAAGAHTYSTWRPEQQQQQQQQLQQQETFNPILPLYQSSPYFYQPLTWVSNQSFYTHLPTAHHSPWHQYHIFQPHMPPHSQLQPYWQPGSEANFDTHGHFYSQY